MTLSTPEEMFRLYHEAAGLTAQILDQARAEQWDQVVVLGRQYVATIDTIRAMEELRPLTADERTRKHDLIVSILENDAATRALVEPALTRLGSLLGTMRRQQSLINSYGAQAVVTS